MRKSDAVDVREIASALRHGTGWLAGGALVGLLLAGILVAVVTPRFDTRATLLLRSMNPQMGSVADRMSGTSLGGLADALGNSQIETEIQVLTSRALLAEVVDSLGLQGRVSAPAGTPLGEVVAALRVPAELKPVEYRFRRQGQVYRVSGPDAAGELRPGVPGRVGPALVTLRRGDLPDDFTLAITGREAAVARLERELTAEKVAGEVVELRYQAGDPVSAAAVPNAVVAEYLERRRTIDRGVNQGRYEFLLAHVDSISQALSGAENRLRSAQERTGLFDPTVQGTSSFQQAAELRAELEQVQVEVGALRSMAQGRRSAREMAGFPTLIRNPAVNGLLGRIQELETKRTQLLERRTAEDPEVVALSGAIRQLDGELEGVMRSYLDGLTRQEAELRQGLAQYGAELGTLPAGAQENFRLQREVRRLSETLVALQTQLVQSRLAAIGEGGDVKPLDVAVVPDDPSFPRPMLSLALGLLGGLFFGAVAAVGAGQLRGRVREPWEAELITGVPAVVLHPGRPLLIGGVSGSAGVLLLPVGRGAQVVEAAVRMAAAAVLQEKEPAVVDLTAAGETVPLPQAVGTDVAAPPEHSHALKPYRPEEAQGGAYLAFRANGGPVHAVRRALGELEGRLSPVFVALPDFGRPAAVALLSGERPVVLVSRAGVVTRAELEEAAGSLQALGVPLVGVVLEPDARRSGWRRLTRLGPA